MQQSAYLMDAKTKQLDSAKWLEENSAALHEYNAWIAVNGTLGDRVRAWKKRQNPNESLSRNKDTNDNE